MNDLDPIMTSNQRITFTYITCRKNRINLVFIAWGMDNAGIFTYKEKVFEIICPKNSVNRFEHY